ncbi:MAG: PASTA domain-containing protein [Acidimicrobiia bacterium]
MKIDEVRAEAALLGITLVEEQIITEESSEGTVVYQDPVPDQTLGEDRRVVVAVATAPGVAAPR